MTTEQKNGAIPAATIVLLRDQPQFEVLMIERHADTPFAGGAIVFPGGRIDPGDGKPEWAQYCDGVEAVPEEQLAPRIAAIREAFEEAGLLLARKDGALLDGEETERLDPWRAKVEADDSLFLELIKSEGLRLALGDLSLFARWEPPLRGHEAMRRYHTWFFAAKTPAGQQAREDGNEATDVFWRAPRDILTACDKGEVKAIFPTRRNLELLNVSKSAQAVLDFAAERKIETVMPDIVERDDGRFLTIPDDLGYPVTEELLETAFRD